MPLDKKVIFLSLSTFSNSPKIDLSPKKKSNDEKNYSTGKFIFLSELVDGTRG
jgi:hypothetical protein